jgi:thymidylate kinase
MLVTVEGLDGAGTTTVCNALGKEFPESVQTAEPSDGVYGSRTRSRLSREGTDPIIDCLLFICDRKHHLNNVIQPALDEGKTVFCDRYIDSTRVYQPHVLKDEANFESPWDVKGFIERVHHYFDIPEADLTLYVDVPVETAMERMSGDEKYENEEQLRVAKDEYDAIHDAYERVVRLDGTQSEEELVTDALEAVVSRKV